VRIAISALGSRGDVLPYVVLGQGLKAAGHDVLVSTMARYQGLVERASLDFHALPGDPDDMAHAGRIDMAPRRPLQHINAIHAAADALVRQTDPALLRDAWSGRDHVVFNATTTFALLIAEELGVGSTMVVMTPGVATGAFAHPVLAPGLAFGRPGNLATWLLAERLQRQTYKEPLKAGARRAWRLPLFPLDPRRRETEWPPFALVHAYSPRVCAQPTDWPAHVAVTGWLLPERSPEPLAEDIEEFVGAGDPPLYIGFGSMPIAEPERTAEMLVGALHRTGTRAIVCGRDLAQTSALRSSERVIAVEELPHERLLDRVGAVVHHGGSGTIGAGLRSGKPTFVVPFVFDQFFWGDRVQRLGAGPAPVPFRRLSEARLADRLAELTSGRFDSAAEHLGRQIEAEDPVARAVEAIERNTSPAR
jgi:sterol 3beta-glucosyltransferase